MGSSGDKHLILLGTHDFFIYSVEFDASARKLSLLQTTKASEHSSWLARHPVHKDIVYSNGWVEGKVFCLRVHPDGKLDTLDEAVSGGAGPTHLDVSTDGSALLIAHYGAGAPSGLLSSIPLSPEGRFLATAAAEGSYFFPPKPNTWPWKHTRLEAPHPHQVVPLKEEVLACDLGSNKVWRLHAPAGEQSEWEIKGTIEQGLEDGDGPRHAVVHPSGEYIYVLNEVSSTLTVHTLPSDASPAVLIARLPFKPPHDLSNTSMIGSELLLLPPLHTGAPSVLLCTNRLSTHPSGDALAVFTVSPDGRDVRPADEAFYWGVGSHIRALGASKDGRWVTAAGRDGGGVVVLERKGDGTRLEEVARLDLGMVVVPLWLD